MPTAEMLYFAYGSNMGASQFRARCPRAVQVGIARVEGYRIGFTRESKRRGGADRLLSCARREGQPTASRGSRHVLTHDAWMARRNPQER
jgi:hypothetical protein